MEWNKSFVGVTSRGFNGSTCEELASKSKSIHRKAKIRTENRRGADGESVIRDLILSHRFKDLNHEEIGKAKHIH